MRKEENILSKDIVDICFKIHRRLGPGLLESVYEEILCYELGKKEFKIQRQKGIGVEWREIKMDLGFRTDVIVEHKVLIEFC